LEVWKAVELFYQEDMLVRKKELLKDIEWAGKKEQGLVC